MDSTAPIPQIADASVDLASVARRRLVQGMAAVVIAVGVVPSAFGQKGATTMPIVRISRGTFAPENYATIKARLDGAQATLVPAIRQLAGCLHYFAAIDRDSASMVNVSVWRSVADAQQMQTLAPMLALAEEFAREGVKFERPIVNYETVWAVP
jgi:quinol monooxygenase YgiN